MTFNFNNPWYLILIPFAIGFIFLTYNKLSFLPKWKKNSVLSLRIIIIILALLILSGLGIKTISETTTTIFLVDGSDSNIKNKTKIIADIKESVKLKKKNEKVGIVQFGLNSGIETIPSTEITNIALTTKINRSFTDIQQGLSFTQALIPSNDKKRVVLITDGNENLGDSLKQVKIMNEQGISIDVLELKNNISDEVQVKSVKMPKLLRINDKFQVEVGLESTVDTTGTIKLYNFNNLVGESNVKINKGENNFTFSQIAKKGGTSGYKVVVEAKKDSLSQNNALSTFSYVEDKARVLVIEGDNQEASELVKILKNNINLEIIKPQEVTTSLKELQKYDGFILANVSAESLDDRFLQHLETLVKHQGKGVLVTGGENSYALGGYIKTPLETILPVDMNVKGKIENPSLGLMLIIDKSGSMSGGQYGLSTIDLAKEAAILSTEALTDRDMIGVIAFDGNYSKVVEMQKISGNLKTIQESIGTIRAGGGTSILPALEKGYEELKNANTKLKHIILLTDGQAENSGYESVIKGINDANITLSTVAVGGGADTTLLSYLAQDGNGRFYLADAFTDIPKIFTKETFLAGKTFLNNRLFIPKLTSNFPAFNGIKTIPQLEGYIGTTAKNTAEVVLKSDKDDPILAAWQYGLGRTVAWTPDIKGAWTNDWFNWSETEKFWNNTVSWLTQKKVEEEYTISGSVKNGKGLLEVNFPPETSVEGEQVEAIIINSDGEEEQITLTPNKPGSYSGSFSNTNEGLYIGNVSIKQNSKIHKSFNQGIVLNYSPEYNITSEDTITSSLLKVSGGRKLDNLLNVFDNDPKSVTGLRDLTDELIILLIILLMFDIAFRRINFSIEPLVNFLKNSKVTELTNNMAEKFTSPIKNSNQHKNLKPNVKPSNEKYNVHTPNASSKEKSKKTTENPKEETSVSKLLEIKKRRDFRK